jgi:EmrB/QacA subfamily drug resistance transporter
MQEKIPKHKVLLTIAIASFLAPFMISSTNIALPSIQKDLSVNAVVLSWIVTSYLLSTAVFLIPAGKISDIYGRKKLFLMGTAIYTVTSLICSLAQSGGMLIITRIFQGLGASIIMTTATAILTSVYPPSERGKALGVNVSMVYVGLACGPTIGGLLTAHLGWRSIFYSAAPIGFITLVLALLYIKGEWADAAHEKLDVGNSILYALVLIAITYGFTRLPAPSGIISLLLGLLGSIAFVKNQLQAKYPVFNLHLFKDNRVFAFSNLAALINYGATSAVTFLLSLYLQYIKGMPPQAAGLVLIVQPIIQAAISPLAGALSDKIEPRFLSSLGMALTSLGLFGLVFLSQETALFYIVSILIVLGLGFALFGSPNTNAIMGSVTRQYYGIASGSVSTMRLLGQNFSMALATLMITLFIGKAQISPETYQPFLDSSRLTFSIFTVLCLAGIYFSFFRGELHTQEEPKTKKIKNR